MTVVVCILTDEPHSDRVSKIYGCFEHNIFDINVYNVKPSVLEDDLQKILEKGSNSYTENLFKYRFNWCLNDTAKNNKNDYLMIVRDDVISSTDTNALAHSIQEAINYNENSNMLNKNPWDILYLSGWGDDCRKYSKVLDIPGYNMYISNTKGPKGSSAFLISPSYRDHMISMKTNKNKNSKTRSMIVLPVPFTVDPSFNNIDLNKINLQLDTSTHIPNHSIQQSTTSSSQVSSLSLLWFVFFVIVAIALVWFSIKYSK